jgi:hypothetical protein
VQSNPSIVEVRMSVPFDSPKFSKSSAFRLRPIPTILKKDVDTLIDAKLVDRPLEAILEKNESGKNCDSTARMIVKHLAENQAIYPPVRGKETLVGRLKSLQGRILTIMDAAFADPAQREAIKTLINKEFRRDIGKVMGKAEAVSL